MTTMADDTVDPQELFMQFAPDLYFDAPKHDQSNEWYTMIEQTVPAGKQQFWTTIKTWTEQPHFVIPPVEKAEILSTEGNTTQRQLIPKRKSKDAPLVETVEYQDHEDWARVIYRPVTEPETTLPFYYPKVKAYSFVYDASVLPRRDDEKMGVLRLQIIPMDDKSPVIADSKMQYALKTILHKLFKWCIQTRLGYKKRAQHDTLVPKETYVDMYQRLKNKYAANLVSNWTEKTDPQKFVFEDIGIASYLLCLWQQEDRKPTFVDLGCGNGLLTYLLTCEGYQGYGIDVAERKIWAQLRNGQQDRLRVEALYPAQAVYPGADWLIGNHADELVPWIPLIAAKSGAQCKFLVIPCCFYGLDGTKQLVLQTKDEAGGKYKAYTRYVKDVAAQCGFKVEEDHLRIPSTKNIAVVGRQRQGAEMDLASIRAIEAAGSAFVPRKNDREKDLIRRERKRSKIEKSTLSSE